MGWAVARKAPASSLYYFRNLLSLAVFLPALLEPKVEGLCNPSLGPPLASSWSQAQESVSLDSSASAAAPCRAVGSGEEQGMQEGAPPSVNSETSANPKFPGWAFPQETVQQ